MTYSIAEVKWPQCKKCFKKMGLKLDIERNRSTNTGYQEKLKHKPPKNDKCDDSFTNLYKRFLVLP